jgi:hypothetical protein
MLLTRGQSMFTVLLALLLFPTPPITLDNVGQVQELRRIEFGENYANVLAFHPSNDNNLYTGHVDGLITMQDLNHATEIRWQAHTDTVTGLVFTAAGDRLISAGLDGCVYIWNTVTNKMIQEIAGCNDAVTAIALSESDAFLAVGFDNGQVYLYDFASIDRLTVFYQFSATVALEFFQSWLGTQGEHLVIADPSTVWIYTISDGIPEAIRLLSLFQLGYSQNIADIAVHPAINTEGPVNKGLMVASSTSQPEFWVLPGLAPYPVSLYESEMTYPLSLDFNSTGDLLAVAGKFTAAGGGCDVVRCAIEIFDTLQQWPSLPETETTSPWGTRLTVLDGHRTWHTAVTFSPTDRLLVSASVDGLLIIWGIPTHQD